MAAFANRAAAYLKQKEFNNAEHDCDAALRVDGSHLKALARRVRLLRVGFLDARRGRAPLDACRGRAPPVRLDASRNGFWQVAKLHLHARRGTMGSLRELNNTQQATARAALGKHRAAAADLARALDLQPANKALARQQAGVLTALRAAARNAPFTPVALPVS